MEQSTRAWTLRNQGKPLKDAALSSVRCRSGGRSTFGGGWRRFAMRSVPVLFAQRAAITLLVAFLGSASLVARFWHLAGAPQPVVLATIMLRDYLAIAVVRFAGSLVRHQYLLSSPGLKLGLQPPAQ